MYRTTVWFVYMCAHLPLLMFWIIIMLYVLYVIKNFTSHAQIAKFSIPLERIVELYTFFWVGGGPPFAYESKSTALLRKSLTTKTLNPDKH